MVNVALFTVTKNWKNKQTNKCLLAGELISYGIATQCTINEFLLEATTWTFFSNYTNWNKPKITFIWTFRKSKNHGDKQIKRQELGGGSWLQRGTFRVMEMFSMILVVVTWSYAFVKTHQIVHLKVANFIIENFYLSKVSWKKLAIIINLLRISNTPWRLSY